MLSLAPQHLWAWAKVPLICFFSRGERWVCRLPIGSSLCRPAVLTPGTCGEGVIDIVDTRVHVTCFDSVHFSVQCSVHIMYIESRKR